MTSPKRGMAFPAHSGAATRRRNDIQRQITLSGRTCLAILVEASSRAFLVKLAARTRLGVESRSFTIHYGRFRFQQLRWLEGEPITIQTNAAESPHVIRPAKR